MNTNDEFGRFADLAKQVYSYVTVCRQKHGTEKLFEIPFENQEQLEDFLDRNHGNVYETGFYAKGFAEGEYIGENT